MKEKDIVVQVCDMYGDNCLDDDCNASDEKGGRKPQGFVEIYEVDDKDKKKLVGKKNLVTYSGREWLATKIFNTENIHIDSTAAEFICWFGLGTGGCPVGDPLNPTSPTNLDTDLDTECSMNATDPTYADFKSGAYYKHPLDSVIFEQDTDNANAYLICRVTVTIGIDDANGNNINEAGLFICDDNTGGAVGPFHLFSRVTFPSIVKTTDRQLIFVWYIYV